MTTTKPKKIGLEGNFPELQTEYRALHTRVPFGLGDVVLMSKRSIALGEQLRGSDWRLQKTRREVQISSSAIFETQHLALSGLQKTRSCHQLLKGIKKHLDQAREKVANVETASAKTTACCKR